MLGIKQPAYSELESGATKLTADYLERLSKFYGMSMDENQHGFNEAQFKHVCDILEGNSAVLRGIAEQQAKMIELLAKGNK